MSTFSTILFILALCCFVKSMVSVLTDEEMGLFSAARKENGNCTAEFSCSGCSKINICKATRTGYEKLITITCRHPTPYCDYATVSCVADAPLPCLPSDNFTCMMDGIFPDKTNCSRYHHCKDSVSFPYSCRKGVYFDAIKKECSTSACYTFNCYGKHGIKTIHRGNPNYFAYCADNLPAIVSKCEKGFEFNESLQKCLPVCKVEGHLVDPEDCTMYYHCSATNAIPLHINCPNTCGFDPETLRCVPLAMLPSCKMIE